MVRIFRVSGMAVLAAFVVGVFAAPSSSAAEFHSEVSHATLSGSQIGEDIFTFNAGTVKCAEATYSGTISSATSTSISLSPSYSECKAFGFIGATVHKNGCDYKLHRILLTYYVDIVCPEGKSIVITTFSCELTIGAQQLLPAYTPTVIGSSPRFMKFKLFLAGISYTQHSKSFPGCSSNGTNPRTEGTYEAEVTVGAYNTEGKQVDFWYE